jgi:hypothetical protein
MQSNFDKWLTTDPNEAQDAHYEAVADKYSQEFYDLAEKHNFIGSLEETNLIDTLGVNCSVELTAEKVEQFCILNKRFEPRKLKGHVIGVGVVNMESGNTCHDWSIYENKGLHAYLMSGGYLLFGTQNCLRVGDSVKLFGNDSQRSLSKEHEVVAISECHKPILISMLKTNGYDYTPIKAFRARAKGNKKLSTSYSIKGLENN